MVPLKRILLVFSLEKVSEYVIAGMIGVEKLIDIASIKPDPRHLQCQKTTRNTLNCRLMVISG